MNNIVICKIYIETGKYGQLPVFPGSGISVLNSKYNLLERFDHFYLV